MKHLTIESFINSLPEEDIWKIVEEHERYGSCGDYEFEARFTRDRAREFGDAYYYMDYIPQIALFAYRHFALKYKEIMKNE